MRQTWAWWRWAVLPAACLAVASGAAAQSLGPYSWQLQPYCNRVVITAEPIAGGYTLNGYDDQCGAADRAPLTGLAAPNPDGSIGLGLTIVTAPGGAPVHVDARVSASGLSGSWNDSAGGTGAFVFGGAAPGTARPVPTTVIAWGEDLRAPSTGTAAGLTIQHPAPGIGEQSGIRVQRGAPSTVIVPLPSSGIIATSAGHAGVAAASDTRAAIGAQTLTGSAVIGTTLGTTATTRGVGGLATTGTGVDGSSTLGTGVTAESRNALALRIQGAITVDGPVRAAFKHTTNSGNTSGNATTLNHPLTNGLPDALLFVRRSAGATARVESVSYDSGIGRWRIIHDDLAAMPLGVTFNVLVISVLCTSLCP
ncbi:MAG: hypothetical protein R2712_06285 [Vicinamibacterales bacterium]